MLTYIYLIQMLFKKT